MMTKHILNVYKLQDNTLDKIERDIDLSYQMFLAERKKRKKQISFKKFPHSFSYYHLQIFIDI